MTVTVRIFTDGSCLGNPGPGGYAAVLKAGKHRKVVSGSEPMTTNNRMELMAVIAGLRALRFPVAVEVVSDSMYVIDLANGTARPKANLDLVGELNQLIGYHNDAITFTHVRGHSGHPDNERANTVAQIEAQRARGVFS